MNADRLIPLLAGALALAACNGGDARQAGAADGNEQVIGLSTSLPIVWSESADIAGFLRDGMSLHWAFEVLRQAGPVRSLDTLADAEGELPLPDTGLLVLAQPWPLSPEENVALDDWVRGGGRVLLFADPMLTHESRYPLGDRRRPQDIIVLSPIMTRWGLVLSFDEEQQMGERMLEVEGVTLPVNLPGRFTNVEKAGRCATGGGGLLARCRIGKGLVLAVADAALLESRADTDRGARAMALRALLARLAG